MQQNTKPTIERIDFGKYKDEVKRIWNGEPPTKLLEDMKNGQPGVRKYYTAGTIKSRYGRINKLLGYGNNKVGFCSICGTNLNTHIMKRKVDGAILITRYCEQHLPNES
jgi:hypothetical protein